MYVQALRQIAKCASIEQSPQPAKLIFVCDSSTGTIYLIDTGCQISVAPLDRTRNKPVKLPYTLLAANETRLKVHGLQKTEFEIDGLPFSWTFVASEVERPILGIDFLKANEIAIIPHRNQLYSFREKRFLNTCELPDGPAHSLQITMQQIDPVAKLLAKTPEITDPDLRRPSPKMAQFEHRISTVGGPVKAKQRHYNATISLEMEQQFGKMLDKGIVVPSRSEWSSAVLAVRKANGTWRFVGDFRSLNSLTINDCYNLPCISSFNNKLRGAKVFSVIDLENAFAQIKVCEKDRHKTAVSTVHGLLEFCYMPPGLKTAAQTFQRCCDTIFRSQKENLNNFIDDFLVFSGSDDEHLKHLDKLFSTYSEYGMLINTKKSQLMKSEVNYLGFRVSATGISPTRERSEALSQIPEPKTFKQAAKFVHSMNYIAKFVPNFGMLAAPLFRLKPQSKNPAEETLVLTKQEHDAFHSLIYALSNAIELHHPIPNAKLLLEVDASSAGYGAMLSQIDPATGKFEPIYLYSQPFQGKMSTAGIFSQELEGLHKSIRHLRRYLVGHEVIVYSDNQNLVHNLHNPREKSNEFIRRLMEISEYVDEVHYIESKQNIVADYLSRTIRLNSIYYRPQIDYDLIFRKQLSDAWCQTLRETEYYRKRTDWYKKTSYTYWAYISDYNSVLICVPLVCRRMVYDVLHSSHHKGWKTTNNMIAERFHWPEMKSDIKSWVHSCAKCQENRAAQPVQHPVKVIEQPDVRFKVIHLDVIGPMPMSNGYEFALTIIDRFTGLFVCEPMRVQTFVETFAAFRGAWLKHYGFPVKIVTDLGKNFVNQFMEQLTQLLGIEHVTSSPAHPESNGFLERRHSDLKKAIRCLDPNNWAATIPLLQLAMNNSTTDNRRYTPAQMVFGAGQRLPFDFFADTDHRMVEWTDASIEKFMRAMSELKPISIRHNSTRKIFTKDDLFLTKRVWLQVDGPKMKAPFEGPYEVIARREDTFTIDVAGKHKRYHIERLQPHYEENNLMFGGNSIGQPSLDTHNRRSRRKQTFADLLVDPSE